MQGSRITGRPADESKKYLSKNPSAVRTPLVELGLPVPYPVPASRQRVAAHRRARDFEVRFCVQMLQGR